MGSLLAWYVDKEPNKGKHWLEDAPWPKTWTPTGVTPPNPTCDKPYAFII
jgi:hypothetical protein